LASVQLDPLFYAEWSKKWEVASTKIGGREQAVSILSILLKKKVTEVAELIEKDFFLLGATAVEDKLQDGVPEAIATLAKVI
jgi:magnesium-transporting ATPase (P-type)